MNIFLWILQGLLAAFFIVPALTKLITPKNGLIEKGMVKPEDSAAPVRIIGIMEMLGIFGIILPWLLKVYSFLTPVAAIGFALIMIGAFALHFSKKEYKILPALVIVFVLSVIVAWFRF